MDRLESGTTGGVVVFDLARFIRRPIEGERLIAAAENGLLVLDSEGEYDLTSAAGRRHSGTNCRRRRTSGTGCAPASPGERSSRPRGASRTVQPRPFGFEPTAVTVRETRPRCCGSSPPDCWPGRVQDDMIVRPEPARRHDLVRQGVDSRRAAAGPRSGNATTARSYTTAPVVAQLPGEPILDETPTAASWPSTPPGGGAGRSGRLPLQRHRLLRAVRAHPVGSAPGQHEAVPGRRRYVASTGASPGRTTAGVGGSP